MIQEKGGLAGEDLLSHFPIQGILIIPSNAEPGLQLSAPLVLDPRDSSLGPKDLQSTPNDELEEIIQVQRGGNRLGQGVEGSQFGDGLFGLRTKGCIPDGLLNPLGYQKEKFNLFGEKMAGL